MMRKPVEPRTQTTTSPRYDSGNVVPMQNRTVKAITTAFKLVVIEPGKDLKSARSW